jgi:hypothetical protein
MISWLLPRRPLRALFLLTLLLCAAYLFAAHHAGRAELRALCESGVEPTIYSRVSAGGYFDAHASCTTSGCWYQLVERPFQFIEFEQREDRPMAPIKERGFYRFSKVSADSGRCDPTALREMESAYYAREFLASGQCIAVEKIDAPTAQYGFYSELLPTIELNNVFGSVIASRWFYIKDMRSDQLVAERTSYLLFQNSLPSFSSFENVLGCPDVGVHSNSPNLGGVEFYVVPE